MVPFLLARIGHIYENVAQKQSQHRRKRELIMVISILHYSCSSLMFTVDAAGGA